MARTLLQVFLSCLEDSTGATKERIMEGAHVRKQVRTGVFVDVCVVLFDYTDWVVDTID